MASRKTGQDIKRITEGPGRFDIAYRLFDGNRTQQRPVIFKLRDQIANETCFEEVVLQSAQREDGLGDCWNFVGISVANGAIVHIFYDLKQRKGTMTFV